MRRAWVTSVVSVLALGVSLLAPPAATAAPVPGAVYGYGGWAAGTFVNVLGGAVRSDYTATSWQTGVIYPASTANSTVGVDVPKLLSVGGIETSGEATRTLTGDLAQTMKAQTARVNLLGGLITADAVATTTTARKQGDTFQGGSVTRLVDLAIAGNHLPIKVPANTKVEIPGIAEVTVNESVRTEDSGNLIVTGSALKVRLLKAIDGSQPGTVVTVNPTQASLVVSRATDVTEVGGLAYATALKADVLGAVKAKSDPTSPIMTPASGTNGVTNVSSLARVTLPGLLKVGAVETTATATSVPRTAEVAHTAEAARLNLLNGLVTANAVRVTAKIRKLADGTVVREPSTELVNLRVAGLPVLLNVKKANRKLVIPGVLSITINEQVPSARGIAVTGLRVTLLSPVGQFPAGVDLRVAYAESWVG